jgi:hypothetical protein
MNEMEHKVSVKLLGRSIPMEKTGGRPLKAVESGKITGQRIIDYNKRPFLGDSRAKGVLGRTGGVRFRVPRVFPRPRPDMIQPRLPPITFVPLKR